jgi:hypothetical protein
MESQSKSRSQGTGRQVRSWRFLFRSTKVLLTTSSLPLRRHFPLRSIWSTGAFCGTFARTAGPPKSVYFVRCALLLALLYCGFCAIRSVLVDLQERIRNHEYAPAVYLMGGSLLATRGGDNQGLPRRRQFRFLHWYRNNKHSIFNPCFHFQLPFPFPWLYRLADLFSNCQPLHTLLHPAKL